jgi:ribose 5-phosphate isomerase RpiB
MIFTARQLEEMHRNNGQVTLPYRARLTPLAQDWIRHKKIEVGYADVDTKTIESIGTPAPSLAPSRAPGAQFFWWCDGPCGPAKAAIMAQSKESGIAELPIASEAGQIVPAIKKLAEEIGKSRAAGGILLVQYGGEAIVYANRCPSLRAILGTCVEAVEQGAQRVAANVLVIEYPYKSLSQVKNLLARFVKGKRELSDQLRERLKELASCP